MQQPQADARTPFPFRFNGRAGEYFKIWIVNILLTILTLGIYSAWAKVRRKRYFYGNTLLQDSAFEYLAQPIQILKGRLIAFAIFVAYALANSFFPPLTLVFVLAFVVLFPWLLIKTLAFNARYSAYRNIRFDFKAGYGKAMAIYIGWPILSVLTLGITYPAYKYHRSKFVVAHSGYGTAPFSFGATAGEFYVAYLMATLITLGGLLILGVIAGALSMLPRMAGTVAADAGAGLAVLSALTASIMMLLVLLTVRAYVEAAIGNLVWNNVVSGEYRFASTLQTNRMLWLYLSNVLAIIFSLGLLIPWAEIRMTRYRMNNLKLLAAGDLAGFVAKEQQAMTATGAEISDFFDFDVGL
jgi:uncharacterized membrane protein YjgN (DUF898 family)